MMIFLKRYWPLVLLILVVSCGDKSNKIGSNETGKRIPLLSQTHLLEADKSLAGTKPILPDVTHNNLWLEAGFDNTHAMPNLFLSPRLKEVWREGVGEGSDSNYRLLASPVAAKGIIYTLDAQGQISATKAETGDEVWSFDTTPEDRDEKAISGGLAIDNNTLFATTGFGEVLALQADDGKIIWRRMLTNPLRAPPTVSGDRLYVVSIENELTALNVRTGQVEWHHNGIAENATLMGASSPAAHGESVIVAYSSGEIYDLRPENGRVMWNYVLSTPTQVGALPAIADIRGLPVVDGGRVYAVSHSGRMASIDLRTGDRVWETDIGGINTPVLAANALFVLSNDGHMLALDRDTGRILWVHELQHFVDPKDHDSDPLYWSGPVLADGKLILVNSLGQIVEFSAIDGVQLDVVELDEPLFVPPIIVDGTIYVITDDAHLVALK